MMIVIIVKISMKDNVKIVLVHNPLVLIILLSKNLNLNLLLQLHPIVMVHNDDTNKIDPTVIHNEIIIQIQRVINDSIIIINQLLIIHVLLISIQYLLPRRTATIIHLVHQLIHKIESKKL